MSDALNVGLIWNNPITEVYPVRPNLDSFQLERDLGFFA